MKNRMTKAIMATLLLGVMLLTGCGINKNATLVDAGDSDKISLGYGTFVAKYTQSMYDSIYLGYMGEEMWSQEQDGTTMENLVKQNVMDMMEEMYLLRAHAEEYDVKISDEEQKAITKAAKAFLEANSKETLDEMCATQEIVEEYLTNQTYMSKVTEAVKASAEVSVKDEDAAQRGISYVVFSVADTMDENGETVSVTDEEKAELKAKAKTVAKAEDFAAAAEEAGGEVETTTYGKDDTALPEKVIEAADALEEGEVSSVVGVKDDGYYVIRLDKELDEEATAEEKESLEEQQRSEYYDSVLEGWKKDFTWTVNDKQWKKVKFDALFTAPESEED